MSFKKGDRATIIDKGGEPITDGVIVSINDIREPSMKYALVIEGYDDFVFCSEEQLIKIEEETK